MEANVAVLIDFENIAAGTEKEGLGRFDVEALMKRIKDRGRILVARSYADWGRFARFKQSLLSANVTMIELTSHGMQDKNRADIAMVVDCLELAFTRDYIDTYVVVSGDSDFTPLVLKMRELNKRVVGCGTRSSTSRLLIGACDEFFFYDSIAKSSQKRPERPPKAVDEAMTKQEAFDLVVEAVEGMQRENPDPPLASVVKSAMRRKVPDFSESEYGFSSFARFLEAAQKQGKIRVYRDQKSGGYRVDLAENDERVPSPAGEPKEPRGSSQNWIDPYAPGGARPLIEALADDGFNPLSAPTRLAAIEHLERSVKERRSKRRRCNVQFVQEDVRKRLRKTHPDVPPRALRNLFNALMRAQVFIHRDGNPVRTGLAPFDLVKNADEINTALTNVYLELLVEDGADLTDAALLSELFLGNPERNKEIEETLAWLASSRVEEYAEDADEGEDEEDDLFDSILSVEPTEEVSARGDTDDEDDEKGDKQSLEKKKKKSRSRRSRKAEAEEAVTEESVLDLEEDDFVVEDDDAETDDTSDEAEPAGATADEDEASEETGEPELVEEAEEAAEPEPKRRVVRRKRKPKTDDESPVESPEEGEEQDS